MSQPILSILIPTLPKRKPYLDKLLACLAPQMTPEVEVVTEIDEGQATTGAKRNTCVQRAQGQWLVHIDDDDLVAPDYVPTVLKALTLNPDAVGYWIQRYQDGVIAERAFHSIRVPKYDMKKLKWSRGILYVRHTNHICPVRASICKAVPFPAKTFGEDTDWAKLVQPKIHSEVFVDRVLYHYYYRRIKRDA